MLHNQYISDFINYIKQGEKRLSVTGLSGSATTFFLSQLLLKLEKPCLIILPKAADAKKIYRELRFFLPGEWAESEPGRRRLFNFPVYDISPLAGLSPHRRVIKRRLEALYALTSEQAPVVITSIHTILSKIIPKKALIGSIDYLITGEEIDRDELLERLEAGGYLRTSLVEEEGDYSVRGGVIDLFSPIYSRPVRLEFWGDRLESIRYFDSANQRSTEQLTEIILVPANEILKEKENMLRARSMGRLPDPGNEGAAFPGQEAWLNHFYPEPGHLFDYLPEESAIMTIDTHRTWPAIKRSSEKILEDTERYRDEADDRGVPFPETDELILSQEKIISGLDKYQRIDVSELTIERPDQIIDRSIEISGTGDVDFGPEIQLLNKGRISMVPFAEKVTAWLNTGAKVVLVCRTEQQADRLSQILRNYDLGAKKAAANWSELLLKKGISICLGRISRGFIWPEIGLYVVSEDEIFGAKHSRTRTSKETKSNGLDWTSFSQLKVGDLVVHEDHGIGKYQGLTRMEIEKKVNDFVIIEYADNDRLYTPADRISIMQKYVGADESGSKLDKLSSKSWGVAKQKAKKSVMKIARQLVEIYALRKHREGFEFSRPDNYFREFEATFEYEETPDQIKAIDDVLSDMGSDRPMDRLVCGDVGFGKTEVAIRAAFNAVSDGKQVAMLVPTTVLAEQHYETFFKRMKPYEIRVSVLSRFKSMLEQKRIVAEVRSGKVDILIGTHRLLQKDVGFKDLGLLIIDEEQRFGVKQKESLKKFRALVDVLALTATPIPRTLHFSLMGIRDLSIIETPPKERQAIQTYLTKYDNATIKRAIESEIERGGQVFFVHNRVKTISMVADSLMKLVPRARITIAHGQMKAKELEETMVRFLHKEVDVLICTTIIESGLDIPSTNTIIINGADRMGLGQIYQLRGRVGRSAEMAYAYLLLSDESKMSRDAEKRLKALMDFSHLGAGIQLAMHDLKIRGGGNILGFSQSGHISAVGYELYVKLIEQSVAELKGEEGHSEVNPEINVNLPAYLPEDYVADIDVRLNLYRRLSGLSDESDLNALAEEIKDRFGPPLEPVVNLLDIITVRLALKKIRVTRLDIGAVYLTFTFAPDTPVLPERLIELAGRQRNRYQFLSDTRLKVWISVESPAAALSAAKRVVDQLGAGLAV